MTADPSAALAAIRARVEAATPGPWWADSTEVYNEAHAWVAESLDNDDPEQGAANADFIAHARDDVPRLVAALDAVLALHPDLPIRLGPDAGKAMCGTCGVYAPCPTVAAITDALNPSTTTETP